MTGEEKQKLAAFLDAAGDFLGSGYAPRREEYQFEDDGGNAPVSPSEFAARGAANSADCPASPASIAAEIADCTACALARTRINAVPGEGASRPLVMAVGEGPGAEEDASGRPFVGKAGQLLDKMLASIGLYREKNCFIANVVKCRPPGNRDPLPEEAAACLPFLYRQISALRPRIILAAGRVAAQNLLATGEAIGRLRGKFLPFKLPAQEGGGEIPLIATYHPSALLRDEALKRPAFEDLKTLMARLAPLDAAYREETAPLLAKYRINV